MGIGKGKVEGVGVKGMGIEWRVWEVSGAANLPTPQYIRCFCATTSHGLVTLTFDLLTLTVSHVQCCTCHMLRLSMLRNLVRSTDIDMSVVRSD